MDPAVHQNVTEATGEQTWRSGDWADPPNNQPPYNGTEITAIPQYDPGTDKLTTLSLVIDDFTNSQSGAQLEREFTSIRDGTKIELPPPQGNVTVAGELSLLFSPVTPGNVVLFVNISWGLAHSLHHADGGILEVPLTGAKPASTAPPATGTAPASTPEDESPTDQDTTQELVSPAKRPRGKPQRSEE